MPAWASSRTFLTRWSPMCAGSRVPVAARAAADPLRGGPRPRHGQGFALTGVIEYSVRSWGVKSRRAMWQARLSQAAVVAGQVVTRPVVSMPSISLPSGGKRGECSLGRKQVQRFPDRMQVCRLPQPDGAVGAGGQDGPAVWGERCGQDGAGLRDYWAGELPAGCRVERGDAAVIRSRDKAAPPGESQHLDLAQ